MNYVKSKSYFMSHEAKPNNINLSLSSPIDFSDRMPEAFSDGSSEAENKFIQSEILKKCTKKEISYSHFRKVLLDRQWTDNEVIFISDDMFLKTAKDSLFKTEENTSRNKNIFEYHFIVKDKKIPLKFDFFIQSQNVNAIIFDPKKLSTLEMFNPIELEKEFFSFQFLKDIGISIGIDAFSRNEKLMEFMIKNPPDWLLKKGNEKAQREHLNQKVNIKIAQGINLHWSHAEVYWIVFQYF